MRGELAAALILISACSATVHESPQPAALVADNDAVAQGRADFVRACGSCHGADARGRGPVAAALRMPPPDLTTLAIRSGDRFPRERVIAVMTGEMPETAHGTRAMPVWGERFGAEAGAAAASGASATRERMEAIVGYLASIQRQLP